MQNDAGIKKRKSKQTSRQKRLRHEKDLQRAETVMDQLEKKIEKSSKRERSIKERSVSIRTSDVLIPPSKQKQHAWDNVNEKVQAKKPRKSIVAKIDPDKDSGSEMEDLKEQQEVTAVPILPPPDHAAAEVEDEDLVL